MSGLEPIKIPRNKSSVLPYSPGTNRTYNSAVHLLTKGPTKNPILSMNTRKLKSSNLPPLSSGAATNNIINILEKTPSNPVASTNPSRFTRKSLPLFGSYDGGRSRKYKKNKRHSSCSSRRHRKHGSRKVKKHRG